MHAGMRALGAPSREQTLPSSLACAMNTFQILSLMWEGRVRGGTFISCCSAATESSQTFVPHFGHQRPQHVRQVWATALWQPAASTAALFSTSREKSTPFLFPLKALGMFGGTSALRKPAFICSIMKLAFSGMCQLYVGAGWRPFIVGDFNFLY